MSFGKDHSFEEGMSEAIEDGAALAWRLLATLEGGSLLLATSALLAYTVRNKIIGQNRTRRSIRNVLVTNTTNLLGRELKRRLEAYGCVVETVDRRTRELTTNASLGTSFVETSPVDAIIVVGAEPKSENLSDMANLVTEDVYDNLRVLELISSRVHRGGYIAWACARKISAAPGAYNDVAAAFDTVLQTSLQQLATLNHCQPVWVGRCESSEQAAQQTVAALLASATQQASRFSLRNAAQRVGEYLGRWLKIVT